jgi:hypothetical protein
MSWWQLTACVVLEGAVIGIAILQHSRRGGVRMDKDTEKQHEKVLLEHERIRSKK